jgi:hypothetical protein
MDSNEATAGTQGTQSANAPEAASAKASFFILLSFFLQFSNLR